MPTRYYALFKLFDNRWQTREVAPLESAVELPGVTWSIEGDVMVEYLHDDGGPGRLIVHELALLAVIKKQLRSRHVTIEYQGF
jgi:hypothetical protein